MALEFKNIGIMSIGEMGLGIAELLIAHGYRVFTYAADRSEGTQARARNAGIELSSTLVQLVSSCDCILSIVPPRDAQATASRILDVTPTEPGWKKQPVYYLDLNAISPSTAIETAKTLSSNPNLILLDGGIIGGVPYPKDPSKNTDGTPNWHCPSLIVSGMEKFPSPNLTRILNIEHLDRPIGAATGLKMCFGTTTKGFIALAIESFTTAHELGVLPELRQYLQRYQPETSKLAEKGLITMPPKAYRWVHEMLEIGTTLNESGGFDATIFQGVSEIYRIVSEDSELGNEQPGKRVKGKTVEDVVRLLSEGMKAKKVKCE